MVLHKLNNVWLYFEINSFLLCTEDDNSCYRNVCKMSVVSFALAVVFIINSFLIKVTIEIFMGTHLFGSPCTTKVKRKQSNVLAKHFTMRD